MFLRVRIVLAELEVSRIVYIMKLKIHRILCHQRRHDKWWLYLTIILPCRSPVKFTLVR